ncbi:MAG: sensor histidine kinase [Nitrospiria bacterium]
MKKREDDNLRAAYKEYLVNISVTRIRLACILGLILVPLFSIIDYFIVSELFYNFLLYRVICAFSMILFLALTSTSIGKKMIDVIGVGVPIVVSVMLSIMIRYSGGYESPYYAGLNLVILAMTLLYVWDLQMSLGVCITIYGLYLGPTILQGGITQPGILVNNSAYLLSTAVIGLTSANFLSNLRYQEFESLYRLDKSQKALQISNEKLRKLSELKNEFFADISHELRTPLAVIRGEAEVSLRGKDKPVEVYKDGLKYIVEMSEQMNKVVSDLLFLARSESGTVAMEKETISLTEVLAKASREVEALADEKGIPLQYKPEINEDFLIEGDETKLVQLFLIILDNAVKYSDKGGEVQVLSRRQGDRVKVEILDSGIGISGEDLPYIFDRFYRAGKTKKTDRKGTGLGLSIAKWIVEAHDGKIVVDSTLNKGTSMIVYFPLSNAEKA